MLFIMMPYNGDNHHHQASIPTAMAAKPRATPSTAVLNPDRARVGMVTPPWRAKNVRGASKVADHNSRARSSQVQNVNLSRICCLSGAMQLHPKAVSEFRFHPALQPHARQSGAERRRLGARGEIRQL